MDDGNEFGYFAAGIIVGMFILLILVVILNGGKVTMDYAMAQLDTCIAAGNTLEQCKYLLVK